MPKNRTDRRNRRRSRASRPGVVSGTRAVQTAGAAIADRRRRPRRHRHRAVGTRSRRLGDRRDPDLPTPFAKIVVTDDRGRYLVPDLPKANYSVWVRGYGLVDSPKTQTRPGKTLDLKAVPASSPAAAAQYYPAAHWLSLMEIPAKSEFPGTGDSGNGINPNMKSQGDWIRQREVWRLHRVPRARHQGHPRDPGRARSVPDSRCRRGIGA